MYSPSSPPVLHLDDDSDHEQTRYSHINRSFTQTSTSTGRINQAHKKRKLIHHNVTRNSSIVNSPKRHRTDQYERHLPAYSRESSSEPELIILEPDEYIIEQPDSNSFRAFDWTIEPKRAPVTTKPSLPARTVTSDTPATINVAQHTAARIDIPSRTPIDKYLPQPRQRIAVPPVTKPATLLQSLPLPKPASLLVRPATKRGRPPKNSRISRMHTPSSPSTVRQWTEPVVVPSNAQSSAPSSSTDQPASESRGQLLRGTGIFSAFHDSKYYLCNICKFKSVTSSILLQHLLTHVFVCQQCSFYTYSHYNLSQHMFDKHDHTLIDDISDPLNPKAFDALYLTRCANGTFALCMDVPPTTNSKRDHDQQLVLSSATTNEQQPPVKTSTKCDTVAKQPAQETQIYVVMKHRRSYSLKKSPSLHSLTLEYNICQEHTIRHMCHTQGQTKRRAIRWKCYPRRLIDEIAHCLRTIVNQIVDSEDNSDYPSLICALPEHLITSVLSIDDRTLTDALKLTNKYVRSTEQTKSYEAEHVLRQSDHHIFVLSSSEANNNEQTIISSLHSSLTDGNSCFTQTKLGELAQTHDTTHRFLKAHRHDQPRLPNCKLPNKTKPMTPAPVGNRSAIPTPSNPPMNPSLLIHVDRNNNSIASAKSKLSAGTSHVIVLD